MENNDRHGNCSGQFHDFHKNVFCKTHLVTEPGKCLEHLRGSLHPVIPLTRKELAGVTQYNLEVVTFSRLCETVMKFISQRMFLS